MDSKQPQIQLNTTRLHREIHARGYSSVQEFADTVGVHRNTVGNYLAGKTGLPSALARILDALDLAPAEVLKLSRRRQIPGLLLSDLIESLNRSQPETALVLFGSRARGSAKMFSDYDIGVYHMDGLTFPTYSALLDQVALWNEKSLVTVQLVDLSRADASFLTGLAEDLRFLAGSHTAWCSLLQKAGVRLYE